MQIRKLASTSMCLEVDAICMRFIDESQKLFLLRLTDQILSQTFFHH